MRKFTVALVLVASLLFAQSAAAVNLVINGGFETGDFSNWTLSGNTPTNFFSVRNVDPHTGTYALYAGPETTLGYISQTLATTPGQAYELSFWVYNPGLFGEWQPNEVVVNWGGTAVSDQVNIPIEDYTEYRVNVLASSTSTDLMVGFRDDPAFLYFDDFSVNAVPVPGSLILFGSGLLALLGRRRLRRG
jgi:hypothetical protein